MDYQAGAKSHPTRVRGLKPAAQVVAVQPHQVAPHAGAWIETRVIAAGLDAGVRRTPRGCVD